MVNSWRLFERMKLVEGVDPMLTNTLDVGSIDKM